MRILLAAIALSFSSLAFAQSPSPAASTSAPDGVELTKLLKDFLAAVPRNHPAVHDRFWADDLIYTRAAGVRIDKPELMRQVREEASAPATGETTTYAADDIRIQQYGTTAIVAFRLVGTTTKGGKTEVTNYFNTGTFLQRNGKWQAVAWQATKIPSDAGAKK